MPLPENFNEWEHVQSVYMQIHNREVRETFQDIEIDDDITTPRGSLKTACIMKDQDTAQLMDLRERLYQRIKGQSFVVSGDSGKEFVARRKKPKINLYFMEDSSNTETGYDPVPGRISFRLMNEPETGIMSLSEARSYGNKIKSTFATGSGFIWRKGRQLYSYADWYKGYQLQVLSISEAEAKEVIEKVLSIQNHVPDWDLLNKNEAINPSTAYPTVPGLVTTVGKTYRLPRRRPVANVRFRYATLDLLPLPRPLILFDRTGILEALVD